MIAPNTKRRWFQFSLRSLFVAIALTTAAFGLGWVSGRATLLEQQRADWERVIQRVEATSKKLKRENPFGDGPVVYPPDPECTVVVRKWSIPNY